jgi:hypothetical protein
MMTRSGRNARLDKVRETLTATVSSAAINARARAIPAARLAHATPPADDEVSLHPLDRPVHPPPFHVFAQVSLDERFE